MTDKEKIRKEVERIINRRLNLINGDYFDLNKETDGFTNEIIDIIDSLQKDSKFKVGQSIRQGDVVAKIAEVSEEGYHCDNAFVPFTAQDSWELVEEPVSEGKDIFDNCLKSEEKFNLPQKISGNIDCENCLYSSACALGYIKACIIDKPVSDETMTIRKEWFEHCKKSWYNEGYIDGKYNRKSQFEKPVSEGLNSELDTYIKANFTIEKDVLEKWDLEEKDYMYTMDKGDMLRMVKHFVNLQKQKDSKAIIDTESVAFANGMAQMRQQMMKNIWKPADGDDLPEIDREVIALLDNGKVVFTHRPPEFWDGKNIVTGKVTRNYPKTYDKGGWNIPDVKYWLDVELPKEIE